MKNRRAHMGSTILPDRQSGRTQRIEIRPKMHCIISLVFLAIVLQPITVTAADQQHHQSTPHRSSESLHAHILQHVVGTAKANDQAAAAFAVIARTIGAERAAAFTITIDLKLQRNTFHLFSTEAHLSSNRSVTIVASSGTAACKGFHHYLKYYCNCHISWDGDQLQQLPTVWPAVDHRETSASPIVYYQNVCTWSYSFVWYRWPEWRRHIDWMALNGITLTLAPVQELVWSEVYAELGMTVPEIDRHFAGPAFMAWQRMGNMRGWGGPLSDEFKSASSALQLRVVAAQRELGMAVALPAFAGHVPVDFARLFPNSSFTSASRWNRFNDAQCCPLYIDPVDPLFQVVGELYLRRIISLYGGENHIFFSDSFNEMLPAQATVEYVAHASRSIYAAMQAVDPNAVWLMQGWMFVNGKNFWTPPLAEAFLRAVPAGRMLVLDLQSETNPQYERMHSFYGQPFVWCMLHNFGGTLGMHGSVEILNTQIAAARKMSNSTMIGFGLTMEGINQNYVMYEFALERGWDQLTVSAEKWFDQYALTRYGFASVPLQAAWQQLRTSVYAYSGSEALHGKYIVCRRPGTKYSTQTWYNNSYVEDALRHLIEGSSQHNMTDLLQFDLIDTTRQYIQTRFDLLYPPLIEALRNKNIIGFQKISDSLVELLRVMDHLLSFDRRFRLDTWLEKAHQWAFSDAERQLIDINARNQITLWGPNGEIVDYAMKQWSGVITGYCLPRWQLFFADALEAMERNKTINMRRFQQRVLNQVEKPFTVAGFVEDEDADAADVSMAAATELRASDVLGLAKEVLESWAGRTFV